MQTTSTSGSRKFCEGGYLCKELPNKNRHCRHNEAQKAHIEIWTFLTNRFSNSNEKKLILGTISKKEDEKYIFSPLNAEITNKYPDIKFIIVSQNKAALSEQHYYEASYLKKRGENGEFFVNITNEEKTWGEIGDEHDDVNALHYGKQAIYKEKSEFTGKFKTGIIKARFDGELILRCSSSDKDYFFPNTLHQNRALEESTVQFLEVEEQKYSNRQRIDTKGAQVVSVLKCPYDEEYIYGMLETTPSKDPYIDMNDLYHSLPENLEWDKLDLVFQKAEINLVESLIRPSITKQDFIDKHCKSLNLKPKDPNLEYLVKLIFKTESELDKDLLKRVWITLFKLNSKRKEINSKKTTWYFRPFNRHLPTFRCLSIQEELKENPDIWRHYIKARYISWPASSHHPWVRIESAEGLIGDPTSDIRAILANNNVKTDRFQKKVQKEEDEIIKLWNETMEKSLESSNTGRSQEIVFSIDGSRAKIRDDAFSIQKLNDEYEGCYRVGIHIADVTKVVKEDSEIFKEAKSRFHSCYAGPELYRSMLPNKLQKHLSLDENQWRYAYSIYITMNKEGLIDHKKTEIKHVLIKPLVNFTYKQVDEQFANSEKNVIQCGDEVKESLFVMRDLALKLSERREQLGHKSNIIEEDEENCAKDSQAHMLVEEFMLLANEIVTDYVKHQADSLESEIVKVRNEEKRIAREELEAEKEEKMKVEQKKQNQKETEEEEEDEPDKEKQKKPVKKIVKKTVKKQIINENNEKVDVEEEVEEVVEEDVLDLEDDHFEEEEEVKENEDEDKSEDEDESKLTDTEDTEKRSISRDGEVKVKRKDSDDTESESESGSNSFSLNTDKIEENAAIKACRYLELTWERIGERIGKTKIFDLTGDKERSESEKSILKDPDVKPSIKQYVNYLLRIKSRKIKIILEKNRRSKQNNKRKKSQIVVPKESLDEEKRFEGESENKVKDEDRLDQILENEITSREEDLEQKETEVEASPLETQNQTQTEDIIENNQVKELGVEANETNKIPNSPVSTAAEHANEENSSDFFEGEETIKDDVSIKTATTKIEEEDEFSVESLENIIKRYYKLKDSQKMKFTSPIRRFHDLWVHYLVNDILEIKEQILTIGSTIKEKLSAQKEGQVDTDKEKSKKVKKIKTKSRYEIFKDLDSKIQSKIEGLAKTQKQIRAYHKENRDSKENGMDRAKRQIEIMKTCKSIISTNRSEILDALIVSIKNGEIGVYLLEYSLECVLSQKYTRSDKDYVRIRFEKSQEADVRPFDDIKVRVDIKRTFPLDFEVTAYSKLNETNLSKK